MRRGQGKENSREFLLENPDILEEVEARVRMALGLTESGDSAPEESVTPNDDKAEAQAVKAVGSTTAEAAQS